MLMRKNVIYTTEKQNMASDFVSVCCIIINLTTISRKNSRKKGMVFKPSFKCLKNKKINFSPAILKQETLLYKNIYILIHLILYS